MARRRRPSWLWRPRRRPHVGDPGGPEFIGYPGVHEPSRGHRGDAPLSDRGKLIYASILAALVLGALLIAILYVTR